jgi:hypothetical protein
MSTAHVPLVQVAVVQALTVVGAVGGRLAWLQSSITNTPHTLPSQVGLVALPSSLQSDGWLQARTRASR